MKKFDLKTILAAEIKKKGLDWEIKGVIDAHRNIYTVDSDTKLISKVFELITTPIILNMVRSQNVKVVMSDRQTVYPDFTFVMSDNSKIALDIKSTYRKNNSQMAGFTLGSYTGYLRNPTKNIMFPYSEYTEHWVLGFIYSRADNLKAEIIPIGDIDSIRPAISDVEIIIQQKYKLASDRPGSGNTANIGSATNIKLLRAGKGVFANYGEDVFEDYWRNFIQRKIARDKGISQPYRNIEEYLKWKQQQPRSTCL